MSDTSDIREWLRVNRPELHTQRGRLSKEQVDAYNDGRDDGDGGDLEPDGSVTGEVVTDVPAETAPESPPRRGVFGKFRDQKPKDDGPKRRVARASTATVISGIWAMGARVIGANPGMIPVSRCLQAQAPAAGMVLDDAVKGTIVDKALQPVARAGKKAEGVASVIGPPLIVGAISANPSLYPVLKPVLRDMLASYALIAGPKIKRAAERERKLMEELGEDWGKSLDELIESFFMPLETTEEQNAADYAGAPA